MIKIITDTKILKQPIPVSRFTKEEQELATAALLTSVVEHKGLGMSANQIGLNKRICVVNVKDEPLILVNPEIVSYTEESLVYFEGCLSLPKTMRKPIKTVRAFGVKVKADNFPEVLEFGTEKRGHKDINELFSDLDLLEAVCVQHEIDHLNGLTIRDRQYTETLIKSSFEHMGRNEKVMMKKGEETVMVKKKKIKDYFNQGYEIV
jgi:peptide deformylase